MANQHDRFLFCKEGKMHFGCLNPFCMHGNPGLPNYWALPMETKQLKVEIIQHTPGNYNIDGTIEIAMMVKGTDEKRIIKCSDNLEACSNEFEKVFLEAKDAESNLQHHPRPGYGAGCDSLDQKV
jgi:hypothetical protein